MRFLQVQRRDFIALAATAGFAMQARAQLARRQERILIVGDSLSAEYGLVRGSGWVALLQKRLASEKSSATVINASISGDTTSGGRSRLGALLVQHKPSHVVIELGGNDALRGLPLAMTRDNLLQMVRQAQAAGAQVLLVGIEVPPNYGADHSRRFAALYREVATQGKVPLVPTLLAGVADSPNAVALFQSDRIHPREAAQARMLENVWPALVALLAGTSKSAAGAARTPRL